MTHCPGGFFKQQEYYQHFSGGRGVTQKRKNGLMMKGNGTNQQSHNYEKQKVATSKAYNYNVCSKYFFVNILNWFSSIHRKVQSYHHCTSLDQSSYKQKTVNVPAIMQPLLHIECLAKHEKISSPRTAAAATPAEAACL